MSVAIRNRPVVLTESEVREAETILSQYPYFSVLEKRRREEIQEEKLVDENIGGGRSYSSSNHGHENIVIRAAEDDIVQAIKHNQEVIDKAIDELEPFQKKIIEMTYFQRFNKPDAERIAAVSNVSRTSVFRFRKDFITYIYPKLVLLVKKRL